ncbi:MAG: PAS domain S-box protein [Spirochaetes bacterium]|nr:MAG: PAS domain S-box protein [Spirochaetota bacterium]
MFILSDYVRPIPRNLIDRKNVSQYRCNTVATVIQHINNNGTIAMNDEKDNPALIDWRMRYQNLLDSLNIGFALVDMNDNFVEVNETLLRLTGAKREQIIGRNNRDFYDAENLEKMQNLGLALQKYGKYQFEFFIPTAGGETIPVLFNSSLNYDRAGQPESINVMITDIREQKKIQKELEKVNAALSANTDTLEKEKMKLEAILFGIGDCVSIYNPDGILVIRNPQGTHILAGQSDPLLPLKPGNSRELALDVDSEGRYYLCRIEEIKDNQGLPFAYVEILKDITDIKKLEQREQELFRMKREMRRELMNEEMIGFSPQMQKVFDLVLRCAEVDSTVLILGETGVGKEIAARAIHNQSGRKDKPFVAVNCGALPESLLESEIFGHVKGAFTGAISERQGLFREANGGTLFLDEVGDIPEPLQVKLLRVLQEREVRPVGGNRTYPVDVRVIAATNKNLQELIGRNQFRHDLYYRIAVIPLTIPPLRERPEDILPLARHLIQKHRKAGKPSRIGIEKAVQLLLLNYPWPGNIRELENAIEHALAMFSGPSITIDDLPVQVVLNNPDTNNPAKSVNPAASTRERDKAAIIEALNRSNWNQVLAAKELGISRTTLWRKITMYNVKPI